MLYNIFILYYIKMKNINDWERLHDKESFIFQDWILQKNELVTVLLGESNLDWNEKIRLERIKRYFENLINLIDIVEKRIKIADELWIYVGKEFKFDDVYMKLFKSPDKFNYTEISDNLEKYIKDLDEAIWKYKEYKEWCRIETDILATYNFEYVHPNTLYELIPIVHQPGNFKFWQEEFNELVETLKETMSKFNHTNDRIDIRDISILKKCINFLNSNNHWKTYAEDDETNKKLCGHWNFDKYYINSAIDAIEEFNKNKKLSNVRKEDIYRIIELVFDYLKTLTDWDNAFIYNINWSDDLSLNDKK